MNKIVVYRTHIEINDYNRWDCPPIEKMFSIFDLTRHRYQDKGLLYDEENKILMLPRGMDISYLESLFQCNAVVDQSMDQYDDIGEVRLKYKPRDDTQTEAIKFMLGIDKYRYNQNNTMLSLNLNTGKGKTYCAIAAMSYLQLRTIVITDSVGWLEQWKNFIVEYTDIKESEIYFITGAPSMMKLFNRDISKYKVILSTHSTIQSVGSKQGWDKIREFFRYMRIGIKFFDEAHLNFDNMFQIDCYSNTFLTYYLTATPGRSDTNENYIYSIYFKNVPSIDLYNKDADAHTRYVAIKYNSNPTALEANNCTKSKYGLDRNKYAGYVVKKQNFFYMLHILLNMAFKKEGKFLFYIGTNNSIIEVRDWIYENYPELMGNVGIYTSITQGNKQEELEKKIILSTTKSAGAAMDIKGLVETINLAEPFKSRVLAQQTFGRTRDRDTIYKDIVDTGFYYTKKFYEFKKPVFQKYATDCMEITLSNKELEERASKIIEENETIIRPMVFVDDRDNLFDPMVYGNLS